MRVLLVYAHPVELSYNAALRDRIVASLSPQHEVDLLDLHAENFNPVMSRAERMGYHDVPANTAPVAREVARLRAAAGGAGIGAVLPRLELRPARDPEGLDRPGDAARRVAAHPA